MPQPLPSPSRPPWSRGIVLALFFLAVSLTLLAQRRLWHTDLWGHLAYGRYYAEEGHLPDEEPFLPLHVAKPFLTTLWLSQWGGYQVHRWAGTVGLQLLYAALVCGAVAGVLRATRFRSQTALTAIAATLMFVLVDWQQLRVVRPQLAGLCCFTWYLALLQERRPRLPAIALVMLLWANLHGSFVMGPIVLGMRMTGRGADAWFRTGHIHRAFRTRVWRRDLLTLAVSLAVTFINPYGWRLHAEVLTFASNPNLRDLIEWKWILATPKQGTAALIAAAITPVVLAATRKRFRWESWLPVLIVAALTFRSSRFIVWAGPLLAVALAPHLEELRRQLTRQLAALGGGVRWWDRPFPWGRSITLAAFVVAVTCSPWGAALRHGTSLTPASSYGIRTPRNIAARLNELQPDGLVLNSMDWGDWIIWSSHGRIPVFTNTHVPLIPPGAWTDYLRLVRLEPGWEAALQRYPFSAAVLDHRRQTRLVRALQGSDNWREVDRDGQGVIFVWTGRD